MDGWWVGMKHFSVGFQFPGFTVAMVVSSVAVYTRVGRVLLTHLVCKPVLNLILKPKIRGSHFGWELALWKLTRYQRGLNLIPVQVIKWTSKSNSDTCQVLTTRSQPFTYLCTPKSWTFKSMLKKVRTTQHWCILSTHLFNDLIKFYQFDRFLIIESNLLIWSNFDNWTNFFGYLLLEDVELLMEDVSVFIWFAIFASKKFFIKTTHITTLNSISKAAISVKVNPLVVQHSNNPSSFWSFLSCVFSPHHTTE